MNASKENCQQAIANMEEIGNSFTSDTTGAAEDWVEEMEKKTAFVKEFLGAALRKLPKEASFSTRKGKSIDYTIIDDPVKLQRVYFPLKEQGGSNAAS